MQKIILAFLLALCLVQSAGAGWKEGLDAYKRGDFATAFKEILPLAEQGNPYAQYNLGVMFEASQGVPQDYKKAAYWYRKAAEQGFAQSQHNLGFMYGNGQGVPQDYKKAAYWYRKAAEQGHAGSQNNLGVMFEAGQGVPQDYVKAHMWFNLAAAQGNKIARKNRDIVAAKMTPQQIAEAQRLAREWKPKPPPKP